jgi:hypothetical protein
MVGHICNPSIPEAKAENLEKGASQSDITRHCLKKKTCRLETTQNKLVQLNSPVPPKLRLLI